MLAKEEFIEYMKKIKNAYDCENAILEASRPWVMNGVLFEYTAVGTAYLAESMITLLNMTLGLPKEDETISYYCWEMEFGETWTDHTWEDTSFPEDHKYRKPVIKTFEDLYDYCVAMVEQVKKEN